MDDLKPPRCIGHVPDALTLAARFEMFARDHTPDGWPAVRQSDLNAAAWHLRRMHDIQIARERELPELQAARGLLEAAAAEGCRPHATQSEIRAAREQFGSDLTQIDEDALVSRTETGVWVQAWVLVEGD